MKVNNPFQLHSQLAADTLFIGELPLCSALLMNEQQFPWVILVPRIPNAVELYALSDEHRMQIEKESTLVASSLMQLFDGDKMNVATLGNLVPQLHIHHVVRKKQDAAWPAPVWGNFTSSPYAPKDAEIICKRLSNRLGSI